MFVIAVLAAGIANAQRAPVIVELFTSEGCSSCPPADNLLSRLPKALPDIDVIPLSEHVDYWNHLGWKDRFSSALYTERQQDYVRTFHLESPYTPEIVVNGQLQVSGGDERGVVQAIRKSAEGPRADDRDGAGFAGNDSHHGWPHSGASARRRGVFGDHGIGVGVVAEQGGE